jgi:hypothetical protein
VDSFLKQRFVVLPIIIIMTRYSKLWERHGLVITARWRRYFFQQGISRLYSRSWYESTDDSLVPMVKLQDNRMHRIIDFIVALFIQNCFASLLFSPLVLWSIDSKNIMQYHSASEMNTTNAFVTRMGREKRYPALKVAKKESPNGKRFCDS